VDTLGLILRIKVHAADIQDRDGAKIVLKKTKKLFPRLTLIWADGGYAGKLIWWTQRYLSWTLEVVRRCDNTKGFKILPKRWIVERTFGWIGRYRRTAKDYEQRVESSESIVMLSMSHLMVRRL
jgi:putative transposase